MADRDDDFPPPPRGIEHLYLPIAKRFFQRRQKVLDISRWAKTQLKPGKGRRKINITRQTIYSVVREVVRRKYVLFRPPEQMKVKEDLAKTFSIASEQLRVVHAREWEDLVDVASSAAGLILRLARSVAARKQAEAAADNGGKVGKGGAAVHIGLGSGHTSMLIAQQLAQRLRLADEARGLERIVLHAISSGFRLDDPLSGPVAFFSYFRDAIPRMEYVGLYCPPMVYPPMFQDLKELPVVKEAFDQAGEIDIVATSLAAADDPTSLLVRIEREYEERSRGNVLVSDPGDCSPSSLPPVGDIQFRRYSMQGPIADKPGRLRAVTLFDIEDYVRMVRDEKKYVVLVAGPKLPVAGDRPPTKASALLPLLLRENLKVWSHLCLDVSTASEVIRLRAKMASSG